MHIVALGWMFVALLMSLVEATSPQGSLLGAVVTLVLYGVLPVGLVVYVMNTPHRRRARRRADTAAAAERSDRTED
jgi:predicted membrane channel-forming protein YqfA (hemolysin III family)